mgnify:CR=1 FL=1
MDHILTAITKDVFDILERVQADALFFRRTLGSVSGR